MVMADIMFFTSSFSLFRIQALIQLLNMNTNLAAEEDFESVPNKERYSSTSTGSSPAQDCSDCDLTPTHPLLPRLPALRTHLFENAAEGGEISQKVSQRAVCWVMTVCWTKDLADDCLWTTLLLYYHFKARGKARKEDLELLLLTCLMIASKLSSSRPLSAKDVCHLCPKRPSLARVVEMEGQVLLSMEFDIVIGHYVQQAQQCASLSPQNMNKLEFVCELLMVKDCSIFFEKDKLEVLMRFIQGLEGEREGQVRQEIKQMLAFKDSQIIVKKFQQRFDVEAFTRLL